MCRLEECIEKFIALFEEYASEDNDCLSRDEFKALVIDEISSSDYKGKLEKCDIDEVFDELDKNDDDQLSFQEYIMCMFKMTKCQRRKAGRRGRRKGGKGKGGKGRGRDDDDEDCKGGGGKGGKGGKGGRGGKGDRDCDDE